MIGRRNPLKLQLESIKNTDNFYVLKALSRSKELATCAIGDLWSSSGDTHQVVEMLIETSVYYKSICQ